MALASTTRGWLATLAVLVVVLLGGHSYLRVLPRTVVPPQHPGQQICQSSRACAPETDLAGPQLVIPQLTVAASPEPAPAPVIFVTGFVPAPAPRLPDAPWLPSLAVRPPPVL